MTLTFLVSVCWTANNPPKLCGLQQQMAISHSPVCGSAVAQPGLGSDLFHVSSILAVPGAGSSHGPC